MATIKNSSGEAYNTSVLSKEIAAPSMASVRSLWYESVASVLTPEELGAVISEVDQNDITNYLTLAEEMEERDLHYHSVLSTRKLAVSGLDVVVEAYSDDDLDIEIADFVTDVVRDDSFEPLLAQQTDALGKGFAVSEIIWDMSSDPWVPKEYKWRDQRHFMFDRKTGKEIRLVVPEDMVNGKKLEPGKFVVHQPQIKMGLTIRGGLARLAAVAYMCKSYTIKDWMAFVEVFGMPLRLGKFGPDASSDQKAALLSAVANIGTDAAAIIPESTMIEFVQTTKTAGGEKLFENLGNWLDQQVSKGVLGQTATTEGTPGRLGSDEAQSAVREDIRLSDSKQLAATLRRDLVKPLVDFKYAGRVKKNQYPKLRLAIEESEDLEALARSLPEFIDRGLRVEQSVILDKFGLQMAEDDAEVLKPKGGGMPMQGPGPHPVGDKHGPPVGVPRPGMGPKSKEGLEEEPNETEEALQRERMETVIELMRAVRSGETLTSDQRVLLVSAMGASKPSDEQDGIDLLVDGELNGWRKMMDPVLQPILDHAKESEDYQGFLAGLEGAAAKMDSTEFAKRLAVATFKTRGLGDSTDDV